MEVLTLAPIQGITYLKFAMSANTERLSSLLANRYEISRQIGEGGMATVFLARDMRHERKVAITVLKPDLAARLGSERFVKEIRVTANLQHPNILPLYDSGAVGDFLYYVMPYVEGESLRGKIDRQRCVARRPLDRLRLQHAWPFRGFRQHFS